MRLTISLLVAAVLLAGCTSATPNVPPGTVSATMAEASTATATPTLPADTLPDTQPAEACPYLDAAWVAQTNGQRVTRVGVDTRFDPPACVFWSYSEDPQLTVLVRHMPSPDEAVAVVDWAAPIATTDPAEEPTGWSGGRFGGDGRAVYAVQKDSTAVVVFSNQEQSLKAELVATEVIGALGL
ncbi:DUF2020 domain-containing protein [Corynebacterium durum]|uniref:DUF2020 domain-containing protein n=1 Tax=Corynebacterium durum TaxID=61592 RepID=UPI0015CCB18D|nr:DUF2020 domain-containing protein [Corynebacterium durum]MDO4653662.1 DUF2020 domain-containing protein [Corynebacterium durum]NYI74535.1 UPF0176 protein [Corynebacterium durum]WJY86252.1 hypothetical protein CDUR_12725 [Corynebacterium durum]